MHDASDRHIMEAIRQDSSLLAAPPVVFRTVLSLLLSTILSNIATVAQWPRFLTSARTSTFLNRYNLLADHVDISTSS